jgi:DNA-binding CsgD family transcriptional regulator
MSAFSFDQGSLTFETEHFHQDGHRVPLSITVMRIQSSGLLLWSIVETAMPASPSTIDPRFAYFQAKRRFGLTDREHEVLALLLEGQSNAEISATLIISVATASDHVQNVMRKVQVQNRARIFKQVILA